MKKFLFILFLFVMPGIMLAQYSVISPDGSVKVKITQERKFVGNRRIKKPYRVVLTVTSEGKEVLKKTETNLTIKSLGKRYSFGKTNIKHCFYSQQPLFRSDDMDSRLSVLSKEYNYVILESESGITFEILAFNNGVAYRYSVSGIKNEYKVLDVCSAFGDKDNAILGTFDKDISLPWSILVLDDESEDDDVADEEWKNPYPTNKIVSWKDALSSVSMGVLVDGITDKSVWGETCDGSGVAVDGIYKYLYGGLSFSPCHELLYVYFLEDFVPFDGVTGSIHSWDASARLGFCLPVQTGGSVWSLIPYASASYLNLRQHGDIHPYFHEVRNVDHYLVGAGMKLGLTIRGNFMFTFGYERQFFTGRQEPSGKNVFSFLMGYSF